MSTPLLSGEHRPGCDEVIKTSLGLKTQPDHRQHDVPEITLTVTRGGSGEIVVVRGRRWGHVGLLLQGHRGTGDWEEVGILARRQFRDTRPLALRGQPEVREYRARFWDGTTEVSGELSDVATVTVSP